MDLGFISSDSLWCVPLTGYIPVLWSCSALCMLHPLIFCVICGAMCWIGPLKLMWSTGYIHNSIGHHHQIESINLTHCCHSFPWLLAWGGCTIIWSLFQKYPREAGLCFLYFCAVLWCAQIILCIMAQWQYSSVCTLHYVIIIIMQTYLKILNFSNSYQVYTVVCV